jgi:5-oxoprolinase (ATP-hydrolysing)
MRARFIERFRELFGYEPPPRAIEVVSVEATAWAAAWAAASAAVSAPAHAAGDSAATSSQDGAPTQSMLSEGERVDARSIERGSLREGDLVLGPAIITDAGETVVLDRGWRATVDRAGDLIASRTEPAAARASDAEQELFAARLEAIALSMGNVLERTALSPNIRDRLDFSCAVLDAHGTLVQNAPHLPVHLGALGVCTRAVMSELDLAEGDIAVTNHPAFGGSHLPDVTTIAPVYAGGVRVAFVAVRAHHAEIGGTRPGSFPPDARSLAEEGVVLEPFLAVRGGTFERAACRARFASGPHPSRNPDENLADLEAQVAATRYGVSQVAALARELTVGFSVRCEGELRRADRAAREALAAALSATSGSPQTTAQATVHLDDGTPVQARITHANESATGRWTIRIASPVLRHPQNFNAPFAVTRAATLYALRLLIDRAVPMNEGLLRSIDLEVPCCMLNPAFARDPLACPPVVAGNVETSQSVVAALVAALGLAAESQSTMNNVLFGNSRFTIYETLGGGAGAGPASAGASAVHVHMSNTRLTDIDVLERRAPVVIRRFAIREGSGGAGRQRGGCGLVREYEFRDGVSLSFFGSRRRIAPMGMLGASPGACGAQHAMLGERTRTLEDSVLSLELAAGDRFTVETPGGGGWGA